MPVDAGPPTYQICGAGCCKSSSLIGTVHASPWIPDPCRATGHALNARISGDLLLSITEPRRVWTVAEAQARLSEILRLAEEEGPQRIGRRRPFIVVPEKVWRGSLASA